jgi:hypothetical protein
MQKPKFISKINFTILLEQIYYIYYNTKFKSVPKRVTIECFHPKIMILSMFYIIVYFEKLTKHITIGLDGVLHCVCILSSFG